MNTKDSRYTYVAFFFLGILIGLLLGLTSGEIGKFFLSSLFTIAGSVAILFFTKMQPAQIKLVSIVVFSMAFGTIIGLVTGICSKENEWFIPEYRKSRNFIAEEKKERDSLFSLSMRMGTNPQDTSRLRLLQHQLDEANVRMDKAIQEPVSVLKNLSLSKIKYIDDKRIEGLYTTAQAYDSLYTYSLSHAQ